MKVFVRVQAGKRLAALASRLGVAFNAAGHRRSSSWKSRPRRSL